MAPHLDRSRHVGPLPPQVQQHYNGHPNGEPRGEAHIVDESVDVRGGQVAQGQATL